jgi:hypothetical protein
MVTVAGTKVSRVEYYIFSSQCQNTNLYQLSGSLIIDTFSVS